MTTLDYYAILGVPRDADAAAIKSAWRAKARKHHPDRKGGSAEMMSAIQAAYNCLKDPQKRAAYDAGNEHSALEIEHEAHEVFRQYLDQCIAHDVINVVVEIRRCLSNDMRNFELSLKDARAKRVKINRWKGRLVRRDGEPNIAEERIEHKALEVTEKIASLMQSVEVNKRVREIVDGFTDNGPPVEQAEGQARVSYTREAMT